MPKPKNKGLGRGLDAIFSDNAIPEAAAGDGSRDKRAVPLSEIDVSADQPRKSFPPETLAELADSIARDGLLQPVLVRRTPADRYEIIAGERRFRAAKLAGLSEIPVVLVEADDATAARYALVENLQREDLNPLEEAAAYEALINRYGLTQEQVADQVGKSRSAVTNALRLLELPEEARDLLLGGSLSAGHARALLGLKDKTEIVPAARTCAEKDMSVRALEEYVRRLNRAGDDRQVRSAAKKPEADYIQSIEGRFTGKTGRRCRIRNTKNTHTIQFEFRDNADLEEICRLLCGEDFFEDF
jgi:ParB family chromosome partitioning protein